MKKFSTFLLILALLAGLSLLLYPTFSNYWNQYHASRAVASYVENITDLGYDELEGLWEAAEEYNQALSHKIGVYSLSDEEQALYQSLLDASGTGIMGYIEIPTIDVLLPIYHGTDDTVLATATGHVEWTSLPVGGESSHCVISGHRGLPSAKLFTNLDQLVEGDTFTLNVLDRTLTYEIDQILIVKPHEVSALTIEPGMDYCTLVTCTPYGVNSHRMLVRGHRIENIEEVQTIRVVSDAIQVEPMIVAPILAAPILLVLLLSLLFGGGKKKKKKKKKTNPRK